MIIFFLFIKASNLNLIKTYTNSISSDYVTRDGIKIKIDYDDYGEVEEDEPGSSKADHGLPNTHSQTLSSEQFRPQPKLVKTYQERQEYDILQKIPATSILNSSEVNTNSQETKDATTQFTNTLLPQNNLVSNQSDETNNSQSQLNKSELINQMIQNAKVNKKYKLYDGSRSSYEVPLNLPSSFTEAEELKIMSNRLHHYDEYCKFDRHNKFNLTKSKSIKSKYDKILMEMNQLFIDDKYKLIMCSVPKAATSNWQRVFNSLLFDGEKDPESFSGYKVHKIAKRYPNFIKSISKQNNKIMSASRQLEQRLNDPEYTVFINVRHPFTRLISAWRDKFDINKQSFPYWQKKFGFYIV